SSKPSSPSARRSGGPAAISSPPRTKPQQRSSSDPAPPRPRPECPCSRGRARRSKSTGGPPIGSSTSPTGRTSFSPTAATPPCTCSSDPSAKPPEECPPPPRPPRRRNQGCERGDHHRGQPPLPPGRTGRTAVPGDQRQRLGDEIEVRQPLRHPPFPARWAQPRHRCAHRRQDRGDRRVR